MQIKNKVLGLWLAGLLVGLPADVTAATVDILASFRPDPSQPARNVFKTTRRRVTAIAPGRRSTATRRATASVFRSIFG